MQSKAYRAMDQKINYDNCILGHWVEGSLQRAIWHNADCIELYYSFVIGSSSVLLSKFCIKTPPLRQTANHYL